MMIFFPAVFSLKNANNQNTRDILYSVTFYSAIWIMIVLFNFLQLKKIIILYEYARNTHKIYWSFSYLCAVIARGFPQRLVFLFVTKDMTMYFCF